MEKKRKKEILVILFALLLPIFIFINSKNSEAATLLKDVWVYDGDTVVADDMAYKIFHETYKNYTKLEYHNNLTKRINNATCDTIGSIRVCVNNTLFDITKKEDKINLKFYILRPDITVTRAISSSTPFLMEEVEVTASINNTKGDIDATDFNYSDTYPEEVEFTYTDGVSVDNKTIYWRGRVKKEDGFTVKYKLKVSKKIERLLKAEYSYYDGENWQNKYTTAFELKPKPLISLTKSLAYKNRYIGQNNNLTINLTKDFTNSTIAVKLKVVLPDNLDVSSYSGDFVKTSNTTYEWSGSMSNKSKGFVILLYGKRLGASDIKLNLEYNDPDSRISNRRNYTDEQLQNFEIIGKDVVIGTSIAEGEYLESYQGKNFTAYVANANKDSYIHNVSITIYTNISNSSEPFVIKRFIEKLAANEQADFRFNITAPEVKSDRSVKFNISVTYNTQYGDNKSVVFERTIQLKAIKDLIITCSPAKTNLEEGEKTTIAVRLQNQRQTDAVDVEAFDISNFTLIKGISSKQNVTLHADKTLDVYVYEIIAPKVKQQTVFTINTTAKYTSRGKTYSYNKITSITVKPKSLDLSATRTYSSSTPFEGQLIDVAYVMTNNDAETAKDIYIMLPAQQEADTIGAGKYYIEHLDPGEKITLDKLYKVRGKFNKSVSMLPAVIYYKDIDGNIFSMNSTKDSLTFKYSYIETPIIIVSKNASSNVGPSFPVSIKIENKGIKIAEDIELKDGDKEWKVSLSPGEARTFTYTATMPPGTCLLDKAYATYYENGLNLTTASESPTVSVTKDVVIVNSTQQKDETKVADVLKDKLTSTETGQQVSQNLEQSIEASKSFFAKIIDFIKGLFIGE